MEGLVIDGGTRIEVDHHAGDSSATKVTLQDPGQFTVSERDHLRRAAPGCLRKVFKDTAGLFTDTRQTASMSHILILVVSQGGDAAPQR